MLVDPVNLTAVRQRQFDAARASCPGFEVLPTARSICERLGLSWSRVLELAGLPREGRTIGLSRLLGEHEEQDWLTPQGVEFALCLVAIRLDTPTLTPGAYDTERDLLIQSNQRRWRHDGQLLLPTSDQVAIAMGSWDGALARAGLAARPGRGRTRSRSRTPSVTETINRFYEHYAFEPGRRQFDAFAQGNGIPVSKLSGRPWLSHIEAWKVERRANDLPAPNGPKPELRSADLMSDVGAAKPGERRLRYHRSFEFCVAWVVRYLESLAPGERPSQRRYRAWARAHEDAPGPSTFNRRYGGWVEVRDAAWKQMREDAAARRISPCSHKDARCDMAAASNDFAS
jgi:hypothetical protein